MDQGQVIEKLNRYKLLVCNHFDIQSLILFGSYAKGVQTEESDIDVAIVVNSINSDYFTYAPLLWKLRREIDDRIEPILIEKNNDKGGFLDQISQYGLLI